jgi:prepilin-type N-terminal cleavage/methylation domain-containing protein
MTGRRGFTLIELMIVIAIIAIIAAIAIPGLLQSQRSSNERNASASLKTLCTAEIDFRSNDRDGNQVNDFWTRDVSGLFAVYPAGAPATSTIRLIELTVAAADAVNLPAIAGTANYPGTNPVSTYAISQPKAGYWYYSLVNNQGVTPVSPYAAATDPSNLPIHNGSTFGFGCYPDSYSSGRLIYVINEGNTLFRRSIIATVRPAGPNPPGLPLTAGVVNGGGDPPTDWPTDANLKADYGKLD